MSAHIQLCGFVLISFLVYQRQFLALFWLPSRLLVLRFTVSSPTPSTIPMSFDVHPLIITQCENALPPCASSAATRREHSNTFPRCDNTDLAEIEKTALQNILDDYCVWAANWAQTCSGVVSAMPLVECCRRKLDLARARFYCCSH